MKKKTKFIIEAGICAVVLGAIVLVLLFAVINSPRSYDGMIERNGSQKEATITLKYNLLGRFMRKLKGTILVETKDGLSSVEYTMKDQQISGSKESGFHMGSVWGDDDPENPGGRFDGRFYFIDMMFDDGLNNIIIYSEEDKYLIYSATEEVFESHWWIRKSCTNVTETE